MKVKEEFTIALECPVMNNKTVISILILKVLATLLICLELPPINMKM